MHRQCLRSILGISWRDHVTNDEVMALSAGTNGIARHNSDEKKTLYWTHPATSVNQGISGLRMDVRRWQGEDWKTEEDMGRHCTLETTAVEWSDARTTASDRAKWRLETNVLHGMGGVQLASNTLCLKKLDPCYIFK